MIIHFFELDPETGIYKAGCTDENGKRFVSCIWAQAGRSYVRQGAARHWFTQAQDYALTVFIQSNRHSLELREGIA